MSWRTRTAVALSSAVVVAGAGAALAAGADPVETSIAAAPPPVASPATYHADDALRAAQRDALQAALDGLESQIVALEEAAAPLEPIAVIDPLVVIATRPVAATTAPRQHVSVAPASTARTTGSAAIAAPAPAPGVNAPARPVAPVAEDDEAEESHHGSTPSRRATPDARRAALPGAPRGHEPKNAATSSGTASMKERRSLTLPSRYVRCSTKR